MTESKSVVIAALFANAVIAVLKFVGYLLTGSPSMLAETYHSISDTFNQVFLLVGIRSSSQEPSQSHPFGHGKAQFFYSFLVAVLLFGIAGWESLNHGWHAFTTEEVAEQTTEVVIAGVNFSELVPVDPFWVIIAVLLGAVLFESYAFSKAYSELKRQQEEYGWSGFREAFRKTSDVTTLTAFTEDSVALSGLVIALVGITASEITGNPVYDAVGAILIGLLLLTFALALAWENKRLLVGESLPENVESGLREEISDHEGVTGIDEFKSMFIGANQALIAADVSFDPNLVTGDIDEDIEQIETKLCERDKRVKLVYIEPER